jgi:hypothetical protein
LQNLVSGGGADSRYLLKLVGIGGVEVYRLGGRLFFATPKGARNRPRAKGRANRGFNMLRY